MSDCCSQTTSPRYSQKSALQHLAHSLDLSRGLKERLSEHNASPEDWEDPVVAEALHNRLGKDGTVIFLDSLQRIAEALVGLVGLDETLLSEHYGMQPIQRRADDLSLKLESLRKGSHGTPRLRKCLLRMTHKKIRKGLHERIKKHNGRIRMLLDGTSAITKESPHRCKTPSTRLRVLAHTLYEVLSHYWDCRCHGRTHDSTLVEAKLCLYRHNFHSSNLEDLQFDVMFSIRQNLSSVTSYIWQESMIRNKTSPSPSSPLQGPEISHREKIECLSKLFGSLLANRGYESCLRMFLYDDKKLWRVSPEERRFELGNCVSLKEELQSPRWTLVNKACLAVTLSHTVLQLSEGPWLDHKWDEAHISFFKSSEDKVGFQRPYVSTRFKQAASVADPEAINRQHPNASLLNLGVILLEIHEWKPMELNAEDYAPNGEKDANTIVRAATRSFYNLRGHLQPNWKKAIHFCLYPQFSRDESRLQEDEIRKAIHAEIVVPLEREYQSLLTSL